jgi:predicted dehydrogenase
MAQPVRWGILGTGSICHAFATDLQHLEDARIVAVGSRTEERARAFGEAFGVARCHGSYEALATDPEVDVVYIGTPHPFHCENTMLCLAHGKHVLCEKPLAMTLAEAETMMAEAEKRGLFLMEALVTSCFPAVDTLRELVRGGAFGELRELKASYGLNVAYDPEHRLFNPGLGGGVLLDLGVYPLALATLLIDDAPLRVDSTVHTAPTGVDDHVSLLVHYPRSVTAALVCASREELPREAIIVGSRGEILVPPPFPTPGEIRIRPHDGDEEVLRFETVGAAYALEANEVAACLRQGRTESTRWPWAASRSVLGVIDTVRNRHELVCPSPRPVD